MKLFQLMALAGAALQCSASLLSRATKPGIESGITGDIRPWKMGGITGDIIPWENDLATHPPPGSWGITPATLVKCARNSKILKLKPGEAIEIQSLNYPDKYSKGKCLWKVKGKGAEKVKVSCSKFDLEVPKMGKCKDFLMIGSTKYCGDSKPVDVVVSATKIVRLMFKANKERSSTGFSCTVTAEDPSKCRCGQKRVGTRIINGKETEPVEYPWQAGLVWTNSDRTWCGGSLINSNWVLSAAHCTIGKSASSVQVLLAEHDVTVSESHTERFNIKQIINHPNYTSPPWVHGHDVSLLELDGRVNFETSLARPICLPTGSSDYAGEVATLTGFGRIGHDKPQSDYLREVDIDVITNAQCTFYYGGTEESYDTMICAGKSDGTGGCMGDSGGPLITKEKTYHVQIGVVSFGSSKCNSFGVFARVTDLKDWIVSNTNSGSPDTCNP